MTEPVNSKDERGKQQLKNERYSIYEEEENKDMDSSRRGKGFAAANSNDENKLLHEMKNASSSLVDNPPANSFETDNEDDRMKSGPPVLSEAEMEEKVLRLRSLLQNDTLSNRLIKPKDLESAGLRRFVRARDGDVDAAFDQAVSVLKWRKDHKVDLILERDYEFLAQDRWGMAYWHGKDKSGRPILVIRGCRHDPDLFNAETTIRYLIWKLETKLLEPEVDDVVVIVDYINATRHHIDMKLIVKLIPLLQNFYPERLGVCFVYPTMPIVWILWKVISKRFDEKTEKKFVFVREQKRDNKFLKLIEPDQLQERFGGSSKADYGIDGLSLAPPESLRNDTSFSSARSSPTKARGSNGRGENEEVDEENDCLGPAAFAGLNETGEFDTEVAIREHSGSLMDEDEGFKQFLVQREKEVDRFQFRLRYQVSNVRVEGMPMDESDSASADTSGSPRSDIGDAARRLKLPIPTTASEAGASQRGKRARVKRFFRRHILRRKSQPRISEEAISTTTSSQETQSSSERSRRNPPRSAADDDVVVAQSYAENDSNSELRTNILRRSISSAQVTSSPRAQSSSPRQPNRRKLSSLRLSPNLSKKPIDSGRGLMDQVKFVMEAGASMKQVERDDPSRETNSWSLCSANRFECRVGPDYKKNKRKATSGAAIYDCVCCDVWQLESKRPHIASYMQLPDLTEKSPPSSHTQLAPLPELLIVNMMMPGYPPSGPFSKKRIDGPGQSIVLFARLSDWAKGNPEDPSLQLWSRFVHAHDGDPFRERLKMITRLENKEEIDLGRLESKLLSMYNGKPWLVRPEYEFHKGRGYFEIDIDYHLFKYFVLSNAMPVLDRVNNAILDCALMVQAEKDQEMPERVLVCTTIRCLNLREAPEIDLVVMDKSRAAALKKREMSFIDRDGVLHPPSTSQSKRTSVTKENGKPKRNSTTSPESSQDSQRDLASSVSKQSSHSAVFAHGSSSVSEPTVFQRFRPFLVSFVNATLFFAFLALLVAYLTRTRMEPSALKGLSVN